MLQCNYRAITSTKTGLKRLNLVTLSRQYAPAVYLTAFLTEGCNSRHSSAVLAADDICTTRVERTCILIYLCLSCEVTVNSE